MATTANRMAQYKAAIKETYKSLFTQQQMTTALKSQTITMLDHEVANPATDAVGSKDNKATFLSWIQNSPLAMKFLTEDAAIQSDFTYAITNGIGTTTSLASADRLPSTYVTYHAENTANEPILRGILALRGAGVASTNKIDDAQLSSGGSGSALSNANVATLYNTTWGATKFNAIMRGGVIKAIVNTTSGSSYESLSLVSGVYDTWTNAVQVKVFLDGMCSIVSANSAVKFDDVMTYANNTSNFSYMTASGTLKLLSTAGGTWAAVTGLTPGSAKFNVMTSAKAVDAMTYGGATFTSMNAAYTVSPYKLDALLADDSRAVMKMQIAGLDFSGLSTAYGASYDTAADKKYKAVISYGLNSGAFQSGITYGSLAASYAAGKLDILSYDEIGLIKGAAASADTAYSGLLPTASALAGFETLPDFA